MENERKVFGSADIFVPQVEDMKRWSVIACDQFSSEPEYWNRVREEVGDAPSTLNLILPEAELGTVTNARIQKINATMRDYLNQGIFKSYEKSYIYVERTLVNGQIRRGIIGVVDLEEYDYSEGATSYIRATEKTVTSRIPPRLRVRKDAEIELPHVILLCDDKKGLLLDTLCEHKEQLPKLYEFDLLENGGHIAGWLVQGEYAEVFGQKLTQYETEIQKQYLAEKKQPMLFAMGDGNHSLATAKACYEEYKKEHPDQAAHCPARYALVELENIHDESQQFEPIHRVLTGVDVKAVLQAMEAACGASEGFDIEWRTQKESGVITLDRSKSRLAVAVLQSFLDEYLETHSGEIDYIHGEDAVKKLTDRENAIGFLLPAMDKSDLFPSVIENGTLPRKTFSMGHAQEKRYYLEVRKIK